MQLRLHPALKMIALSWLALLFVSCAIHQAHAQNDLGELNPETAQLLYDALVKRPNGGHKYSFGLGKRSPEPNPAGQNMFFDDPLSSGYKRRQYNFGLGKRPWPMNDYDEYRKRKYNFGLGKRTSE